MSHLSIGALQKALRTAVDDPTAASELLARLFPVFVLGDLTQPENIDAQSIRFSLGGDSVTGVTNRAHVQLLNPVGSGTLVRLEQIHVSRGAAGQLEVCTRNPALSGSGNKAFRDSRLPGSPVAQVLSQDRAAVGTLVAVLDFGTSTNGITQPFPWVLGEGRGILLRPSADAVGIHCSFWWREINL